MFQIEEQEGYSIEFFYFVNCCNNPSMFRLGNFFRYYISRLLFLLFLIYYTRYSLLFLLFQFIIVFCMKTFILNTTNWNETYFPNREAWLVFQWCLATFACFGNQWRLTLTSFKLGLFRLDNRNVWFLFVGKMRKQSPIYCEDSCKVIRATLAWKNYMCGERLALRLYPNKRYHFRKNEKDL